MVKTPLRSAQNLHAERGVLTCLFVFVVAKPGGQFAWNAVLTAHVILPFMPSCDLEEQKTKLVIAGMQDSNRRRWKHVIAPACSELMIDLRDLLYAAYS